MHRQAGAGQYSWRPKLQGSISEKKLRRMCQSSGTGGRKMNRYLQEKQDEAAA